MYDEEGFADPVLIESLAVDVNRACIAARKGDPVVQYQETFQRASRFLEHARAGDLTEHRQHLSATPSLDLLVAEFAREATQGIQGDGVDHMQVDAMLVELSTLLRSAGETGRLITTKSWSLETIERVWNRLFWLAAERAAVPTDLQEEQTDPHEG